MLYSKFPFEIDFHERDFFISRITAGYLRYKYNNKTYFIHAPDIDTEYSAKEVYIEEYNKAKEFGLFTDEDAYDLLIKQNLWNDEQEKILLDIPRHIEIFKEQLFDAYINFGTEQGKKIVKYLKRARDEYDKLYQIRHMYDTHTCHGHAITAALIETVSRCTKLDNNKKCNWNELILNKVVDYYNKSSLSPENIRYLAKTTPWVNIWPSAKSNGQIFNRYGAELTIEQRLLLMWSRMYDNINESVDCPTNEVINDDDLLDGWMIKQRKKNKEETKKGNSGLGLSRTGQHEEVYIVAKNQEQASKIYSMNDGMGKGIIKQRLNLINKEKEVKHGSMPDIKQRAIIFANQAFAQNMKGK